MEENLRLNFTESNNFLTLGVEIELQVMEKSTNQLTPKAHDFIANIDNPKLTKELFQSMLEIITGICTNAHEAYIDLDNSLKQVDEYASDHALSLCSTGSHPTANYNDRIITESKRYHELIDRNQWLSRRTSVYGLHVHVGMRNGDECIDFSNFFVRQLPILLALSASSPYWIGKDSGLASTRPTVYEAIPTCGLPYFFKNWEAFNKRYQDLIRVQSIKSMKDLWWDLRPSPGHGTLEIRICDGPATLKEMKALVAMIHAMANWYSDNKAEFNSTYGTIPERWILRENKWRAIRHGLEAQFIDESTISNLPARTVAYNWLEKLSPYFKNFEYNDCEEIIVNLLQKGNSTSRQRKVYERSGDLEEVVRHNISEHLSRQPIWIS